MNYSTPEITVLGDATLAIQGTGTNFKDSGSNLSADCDLDD